MPGLERRAFDAVADGAWVLPQPGGGDTTRRHLRLAALGRDDLSLARIAEAHTDALAILAEAARTPRATALYGVWASDGPQSQLRASRRESGGWLLDGTKQFCSGASFVTAALVTAHAPEGLLLFDIALDVPGLRVEPSQWASPGLADTDTAPVAFSGVTIGHEQVIGAANWYLNRPGFWHGAIGPAACWAGGAMALVDAASRLGRKDPHSRAHRGALEAAAWGMSALLERAGRDIDADPLNRHGGARRRALMVRHLIERGCAEVMDRFGRGTGPHLLAGDSQVARQFAALAIYTRQCHGERDLADINP
jgi:alkylation response protein AidB-like acyl-CoA dehydrogenase